MHFMATLSRETVGSYFTSTLKLFKNHFSSICSEIKSDFNVKHNFLSPMPWDPHSISFALMVAWLSPEGF
jgi:hypothetical protein